MVSSLKQGDNTLADDSIVKPADLVGAEGQARPRLESTTHPVSPNFDT